MTSRRDITGMMLTEGESSWIIPTWPYFGYFQGGELLYQCIASDQEFWGNYSQSTEGVSIQCLVSVEIL